MTRLRLMLLALSMSLWALVIVRPALPAAGARRAPSTSTRATRQSERTINLDPRRGPILDRNGHPLAVSVDAESLYAVPQDIAKPAATAARPGPRPGARRRRAQGAAGPAPEEPRLRLGAGARWTPPTARTVRALQLDGIGFLTENRRYYPKRELASQVLGYVGVDNTGMSGIEYAFEDAIRGRAAKVVVTTDARRRPVGHTEKPVHGRAHRGPHPGRVDPARGGARARAGHGGDGVRRRGGGGARARRRARCSPSPTARPSTPTASPPIPTSRWRNRAVTDAYEPGASSRSSPPPPASRSTWWSPDEVLDCGHGAIEIAGTRINDHAVFDKLTFKDAVARSSDIGMIRVAQRVGRENFNRYMRDFGFGAPSGIDLPGESAGLLRPTAKWSALSLPSLSFGQEIGVTALQMAMAAAAVANGGYLMKPLVVRRVEDATGRVVKEMKPVVVRRVLRAGDGGRPSPTCSQEVVRSGHRQATRVIPGYVVAGKTGTAQKIDASGHYSMIDHVASFVGFVPASRPALVVLVSLDSPRGPRNQGGDVAAPVFARVAEAALRYRAVAPGRRRRGCCGRARRPRRGCRARGLPAGAAARRPRTSRRAGTHARPARPLRARGRHRGRAPRPDRGARGSGRVVAQTPEPGTEIEAGKPVCPHPGPRDREAAP